MATGLAVWSKTAASNSTADSSVNWAEGQAPSSVNDSARALMASVAKFRDDINGSINTGGSSTAYTVTSNQSFGALTAGYMVAFTPHTTNGATVTIDVDSLGAKPLRSAPAVELGAGVLSEGTPYVATYYTSNSGEWILHGFFSNPYDVPLGSGMDYWATTAPNSNFVFAYGQALSRTTYATLFSLFSTTYGVGDGTTTFNIPDKRGRASAGKDDMGGTSANRLTNQTGGLNGDTLGATGGNETNNQVITHTHGAGSLIADSATVIIDILRRAFATSGASDNQRLSFGNDGGVTGTFSTNATGAHTHTVSGSTAAPSGAVSAFNIVQPTIVCNYIIRVI